MLLEYAINKAGSFDTEAIRTALENAQGVKLFSDDNFTVDKETHNPLNKTVSVLRIVEKVLSIWRPSLAFARLCTAQLSVKAYFLICRKQKSAPFGIDPSLNRAHKIQL